MIATFQNTGRQRGNGEVVIAVEDADDDPRHPEQDDDREEDARQANRERPVVAQVPEEPITHARRARRAP